MPKREPRKVGRQGVKIDWNEVALLLEAGCIGTEIAESMGLIPTTLYDRCKADLKCTFTELSQEKRTKGGNLLKLQQYMKALGKTNKGDNNMLIWLGKNRLRQCDNPQELELQGEALTKYNELMNLLNKQQEPFKPKPDELPESNITELPDHSD